MEIVVRIWILFALSVKHSASHNQLLTVVWQKTNMGCMKKINSETASGYPLKNVFMEV